MTTSLPAVLIALTGAVAGYNLGVILGLLIVPPGLEERWVYFGTGPLGAVLGANLVSRSFHQ